jgi:trk system potassium uptake protein
MSAPLVAYLTDTGPGGIVLGMHIIIVGAGNVGYKLARHLIDENKDVVLIERNSEMAAHADESLDCLVLNESGNNIETLKKAGITQADTLICVTESDEMNLIACSLAASQFQVPAKIARVRNLDYSGLDETTRALFGVDFMVNPDLEVARAITGAIERGVISDVMVFEHSSLQMRNLIVTARSPFAGRTLREIRQGIEAEFLVAVILRDNGYIIPKGDLHIEQGDKIYLLASEESFKRIFNRIGKSPAPLKRIALAGGTQLAEKIISEFYERRSNRLGLFARFLGPFSLAGDRRKIIVVEENEAICRRLSEDYPDALVINADISDERFTEEEHVLEADLFISTDQNQEKNIVSAVYAKTLGARRTIALVNKSSYVHVATDLGIDVAISPTDTMVNTILNYLSQKNVKSVHSISGGLIEVLEVTVESDCKADGRTIQELKLPRESLILSITREGHNIIPTGQQRILRGDDLILITKKETVDRLQGIFTA